MSVCIDTVACSDLFFHVNAELPIESVAELVEIAVKTDPKHTTPHFVQGVTLEPHRRDFVTSHPDLYSHDGLRILVLGPPGAGSTTQAAVLADKLSVGLISPVMTLREEAMMNTNLGLKAKPYIDANESKP